MSAVLNHRNRKARLKYMYWSHVNFSPNIRQVSEAMGLNYNTFRSFLAGKTLGVENLRKVENFLDSRLKQHEEKLRERKSQNVM